ncbi:PLP-dependent aminotransferase family protein [Oleidesulfovibrio sp.]|uniref:MocR-like pyridoxine biosynthesis transcription factor PdxR n=1 Tax=Oleidesulfovibrio sp. TaxID=2909707 RepID=UPI003A85A781
MWITLDHDSKATLSRQIYRQVKAQILTGELRAGKKLPSSRALAKDLSVARNTVMEAYDQLLAEGYLVARHGSGTIVAEGIRPIQRTQHQESNHQQKPQLPMAAAQPVISFRSGIPALDAFPAKEWGRLYQRTCEALPPEALRYCAPAGVRQLREAITAYLLRIRGIRVSPERIMVTSGATQALLLISKLLYKPDSTVVVEDPVHSGLTAVISKAGYTVRSIRADNRGLDTSQLQRLSHQETVSTAFAYVTPSHQYPLGGILPVQRRQELIRFAQAAGCFIVEDDYDSEFRYEGAPVSSLYELAPDTVIYVGSFSKIMAPALRLGFAIIPGSMIDVWQPEKMYMDVHTDALSQHTLAAFINSGGLERHIWKMKKLYSHKRAHLIACLTEQFGPDYDIEGQATGLHLVAGFPQVNFSDKLIAALHSRGVQVTPVEKHSLLQDGTHKHKIILGYSHLSDTDIAKGVGLLRNTLQGFAN